MVSYLALAYLKGDSAKAAKIIVALLVFISLYDVLNLNPFDKISQDKSVASVFDLFGSRYGFTTLNVDLVVSRMYQSEVESARLIITHRGLNPHHTNGPSADPFPV